MLANNAHIIQLSPERVLEFMASCTSWESHLPRKESRMSCMLSKENDNRASFEALDMGALPGRSSHGWRPAK